MKTNKVININPKDLNNDSLLAVDILINYALEQGFIKEKEETQITLNSDVKQSSVNITSDSKEENIVVINKNYQYSVPSFCATLDKLGFNVDKEVLYSIYCEDDVIIEHSLVKK